MRTITARYPGQCSRCSAPIARRQPVGWDTARRELVCLACLAAERGDGPRDPGEDAQDRWCDTSYTP